MRQFIFPLLVISSKKRVNDGKSDKTINMEVLLMKFPKKYISIILEHISTCYKQKIRVLRQFIFPLLVISSNKRVNNGKKWQNAKYGGVANEISKNIYIHNIGAYINILQTNKNSIETIYFSKILSMGPLVQVPSNPETQQFLYIQKNLWVVQYHRLKYHTHMNIFNSASGVWMDRKSFIMFQYNN